MNDSSGGQGIAVGKRVAMADMAMPASSGKQVALGKYRGKKLVVYFYEGVT
jgi:peroxiredoxin